MILVSIMGLFGSEPEKLRIKCTQTLNDSVGEYDGVVCKVYVDDKEVSEVKVKVGEHDVDFEATNPKYIGLVVKELKKNGLI